MHCVYVYIYICIYNVIVQWAVNAKLFVTPPPQEGIANQSLEAGSPVEKIGACGATTERPLLCADGSRGSSWKAASKTSGKRGGVQGALDRLIASLHT